VETGSSGGTNRSGRGKFRRRPRVVREKPEKGELTEKKKRKGEAGVESESEKQKRCKVVDKMAIDGEETNILIAGLSEQSRGNQ
jgi:hypothetical protein